MDVDEDEDDEEEEWHLDVEEDDIQDATDINMDKIDYAVDVEKIVKEWQMFIHFINRGMKHLELMKTSLIFVNHLELMNNLVSVSSSVQNQS
jgi:hypothetical protein